MTTLAIRSPNYQRSLTVAADYLLSVQSHDGGWGVTPTSVSSIVNTAEALTVLRAAGIEADQPIQVALDYIAENLPLHTKIRKEGGRGANIRFAAFGLEGLTTYPEHVERGAVADGCRWAIEWLTETKLDEGWPETQGTHEASLHQSALVAINLSRLLKLPGAPTWLAPLRSTAQELVVHGCEALLRFRRSDGSLPQRTYVPGISASPTKTALAATAYASAIGALGGRSASWGAADRDDDAVAAQISWSDARDSAAAWLQQATERWRTLIEADLEVQGTQWAYLAYAQCVRGIAAGSVVDEGIVRRRLRYLQQRWQPEHRLWAEPHTDNLTIRAAYHTVWAFEAFRSDSRLLQPGVVRPSDPEPERQRGLQLDRPAQRLTIRVDDSVGVLTLSDQEVALVGGVLAGGIRSAELAASLGLAVNSIPKTIERLNGRIADVAKDHGDPAPPPGLTARRITVGGTSYYVWTVSPRWSPTDG